MSSAAMDLTAIIRAMRDAFDLLDKQDLDMGNPVLENLASAIVAMEDARREINAHLDDCGPLDVEATDMGTVDFEDVPL